MFDLAAGILDPQQRQPGQQETLTPGTVENTEKDIHSNIFSGEEPQRVSLKTI